MHQLKICRRDLADKRLGGTGDVIPVTAIDSMRTPAEVSEEIGLTKDGELTVVKEESYNDRLALERKYDKAYAVCKRRSRNIWKTASSALVTRAPNTASPLSVTKRKDIYWFWCLG